MVVPRESPNDLLSRFFELKRERGCLPTTVSQYRWAIQRAMRYLRQAGRPTDPRKWSVDDARFLRNACREDPWRVTIIASLARFARNFVFYEVGLPPKPPPRRVCWLTEEQVRAISDVTRGDPLLRLVALLGVGQGLRRIEWLRLRLDDVEYAVRRILVRGKGRGQPKIVWMAMHPALPQAIADCVPLRKRIVRRELRRRPRAPVPRELLIHR